MLVDKSSLLERHNLHLDSDKLNITHINVGTSKSSLKIDDIKFIMCRVELQS